MRRLLILLWILCLVPGELGTDLGALGGWWDALVARSWDGAVESSIRAATTETERRA